MMAFLAAHGIEAMPKYLVDGSQKGQWRLYNRDVRWSQELADKLNALGFTNHVGEPLDHLDGNGGMFSVFVRGHNELLTEARPAFSLEQQRDAAQNEANARHCQVWLYQFGRAFGFVFAPFSPEQCERESAKLVEVVNPKWPVCPQCGSDHMTRLAAGQRDGAEYVCAACGEPWAVEKGALVSVLNNF